MVVAAVQWQQMVVAAVQWQQMVVAAMKAGSRSVAGGCNWGAAVEEAAALVDWRLRWCKIQWQRVG